MNIKYEFVTGEVVELEVSEELGNVSIEIDREIANRNRAETRRHESYSDDNDKQETLEDKSINVEIIAEQNEEMSKLQDAISKLKPHQQDLIQKIFYEGLSETQVAKMKGVSQQAISKQLKVIYKNLKKFLEIGL